MLPIKDGVLSILITAALASNLGALNASHEPLRYVQIITVDSKKELARIVEFLKSGRDFSELAREFSSHSSAQSGGFWGPISDPQVIEALEGWFEGNEIGETAQFNDGELGPTLLRRVDSDTARNILYQLALDKGKQYLGQSRGDLAIEAFKTAIQHQPQAAEAHMMVGYTYRLMASSEMIAEAKAELRQAVALDPNLAWARFYLARIYVDLGRLGKAKDELTDALRIEPQNPFFLAFLGDVNRQSGDPNLSIQLNLKAAEISPTLSLAHYYLGLAYNDLDERDKALRELETAIGCPQVLPEMHVALGSAYSDAERYSEAIRQFERAIELEPGRAKSHLELAKAYRLSGRLDLAEKELSLLQGNDQMQIQSPYFQEICAEASFESGLINRSQGRMSQARKSFLEAVEVKQSYGLAHQQLAEVLFFLEEYSEALQHAIKAEELGTPLDPSLFNKIREKVPAGSEGPSSEQSRMDPR